jgi:hypothetical protein
VSDVTRHGFERLIAQRTLGKLSSRDLPSLAWAALELGHDGSAIRRLAALDAPSYFEIGDLFDRATQEMRRPLMTKKEAAILLAKDIALQALSGEKPALDAAYEIYLLGYDAGMPDEVVIFGGLDQDFDIPSIYEECESRLEHR